MKQTEEWEIISKKLLIEKLGFTEIEATEIIEDYKKQEKKSERTRHTEPN